MRSGITLKSPAEIAMARAAGHLAAEVLRMIAPYVQPGVNTEALDQRCNDFIVNELKVIPANVGYMDFPKTVLTSVNHVVCHGIPSADKVLKAGDIVNIDVAVIKEGWFGDTSRMFFVGEPSVLARRLVDTTYEALCAGIRQVRPGATLGMWGTLSRPWRTASGSAWCVNTAATASVRSTTTIRMCRTTASAGRVCGWRKAWSSPSSP